MHLIDEAFYLEDILNNEKNTNHTFIKQSPIQKSWLRQKLFDEYPKLGKLFISSISFYI
jgi:hypothetical protein